MAQKQPEVNVGDVVIHGGVPIPGKVTDTWRDGGYDRNGSMTSKLCVVVDFPGDVERYYFAEELTVIA